MQAVVLAGGNTCRLQTVAAGVPKPMLPLFDQPVLEHTIKHLASHGIKDIILCTSHAAPEVSEYFGDGSLWGVKISYSIEHEPRGTAGAVKLVQRMLANTFLVVSGDVITDIDLSEAIARHRASSAIASILLHEVDEPTQYGQVLKDSTGKITHFLEKPRTGELPGNTISTGIYVFEPEALSSIPYDEPCDFARQVFPRLLNNKEPVYGFDLHGYWCDSGDMVSYHRVHFDALAGQLKLDLPASQVDNGVWMGERAEVHPSVEIGELVYIGAGAQVKRTASLRGKAIIGEETVVDEGASIFRSVIGRKSHIGRNSIIKDTIVGSAYSIADEEQLTSGVMVSDSVYEVRTVAPKKNQPTPKRHQFLEVPILH